MIARNMAPGLRRTFSFEEWNWMDDRLIHEVRQEASRKINREIELDIMGTGISMHGWLRLLKKMLRKRALAMTLLSNKCESKISTQIRSMG